MNVNYLGLTTAVLSLAAFSVVHARLRPRNRRAQITAVLAFGVLALPALAFGVYYLHILPETAALYELRSWRGSEWLSLFLGAAGGAFAALLPRPLLVLPLLTVAGFTFVPYLKPVLAPLDESILKDRWQGDACLQSTASTCGPASVCTILKRLGGNPSERDLAHAAHSYAGGTEAWYLARLLRQQRYAARFVFRKTFTPSAGVPAVVGVRLGGAGHFIAVLDIADGKVTFADPLHGEEQMPLAMFLKAYQFTGFHLVIGRR